VAAGTTSDTQTFARVFTTCAARHPAPVFSRGRADAGSHPCRLPSCLEIFKGGVTSSSDGARAAPWRSARPAPLADLNRKKAAYERFGVPTYWIVKPVPAEPELTVFELRDGRYTLAAKASGPFAVDRPFHVSIDPVDLSRGLRR
jgi:hypothetical protein